MRQMKKAVQWYDGMLLRPEHFQQADRRVDQLLCYHLQNSLIHFWGVNHLRIDDLLLKSGIFRILELEAIMPDGLAISAYADEGDVIEIDLRKESNLFSLGAEATVYLAVPEYRPDAANVDATFPRFKSVESGPIVNENTGVSAPIFPCIKPNILLFIGEEPSSRFIFFPLAKISKENHSYSLSTFSPPLLTVRTKSLLNSLCTDVALKIRNKITFLGERISADKTSIMAQEANEYMKAMSAALLPYEAVLNVDGIRPFNLYLLLCSLAGHLCSLVPNQIPPGFKPYDHNNLRHNFEEVIEFIDLMLERVQEGYLIIPFEQQDRIFRLEMARAWLDQKLIFGAKATPGMSEKDLIEWVASCVIASKSVVESVRDKRILGAQRVLIEGDEELKLLPSKDMVLFEIKYDEAYVKLDEVLQIFNVADTPFKRPQEIIFYLSKKNLQG